MKQIRFMAALICLLASASPASAQLVIRNGGHAEIGVNPTTADTDSVTVLKIFGNRGENAAGGRISFGDGVNVAVGELGTTDSDRLWLHGKSGMYLTAVTSPNVIDTIAFFDPTRTPGFHYDCDVTTSGLFVQSDERYKEHVEPVGSVLSSLETLEPVTYTLKAPRRVAASSGTGEKNTADRAALQRLAAERERGSERYGFLAQNVKEAFPELVHTDDAGYMSVDYIGLIPILVQSINELRAELAAVKAERQAEEDGESQQQAGQQDLGSGLHAAKLYQNAPNPWNSETVIRYSLPSGVTSASIYIYDMRGAQLKCLPADGRGESQVTLTASGLGAGMYLYALVADGALVDSKQMILTK